MSSESRKTTASLTFRLTPEDRAIVAMTAATSGIGPTTWARRAVLRAAGHPVPSYERRGPDELAAAVAEAIGQLGRIGNNINQVAKMANATGLVDTRRFDAALDELRAFRSDFRNAYDAERQR